MNQATKLGAVLWMAAISVTAPTQSQPPPGGAPPPILKPQNLKVLPKDIAVPTLMTLMQHYDAQLGVQCGYCHAADPNTHKLNFASDANSKKATARIMMTMTANINDKYISSLPEEAGAKVECGTCHRGQAMPAEFSPGN